MPTEGANPRPRLPPGERRPSTGRSGIAIAKPPTTARPPRRGAGSISKTGEPRSAALPLGVSARSRVRQRAAARRSLLVPSEAVARQLPRAAPGRSGVTEPILFPKLRIRFADFPYLHSTRPRGCSPWRPDAEFGTLRHGRVLCRSPGFSRSVRRPRDPAESTGLWRFHDAPVSLSPRGAIRGNGGASARTDNSAFRATVGFPGSRRLAARDLLRSQGTRTCLPPLGRRGERPVTGFPNRYGIPSRLRFARRPCGTIAVVASLGFLLRLRTDSPMCKGCSHGTLLLVIPPGSRSSTRYYHQDLHRRRLRAGSRPDPSAHDAATFLLSETYGAPVVEDGVRRLGGGV